MRTAAPQSERGPPRERSDLDEQSPSPPHVFHASPPSARRPRTRYLAAAPAVTAMALAAVLSGCGTVNVPRDNPASFTVDTSAPRVAASTFPELAGYQREETPAADWEPSWQSIRSSYHGGSADAEARYIHDSTGNLVALVVVATPTVAMSTPAAMKAAMDQQTRQAGEHFGLATLDDVAGHEVMQYTGDGDQPNWYWISGDEFVMVTAPEQSPAGAQLVALLSARTRYPTQPICSSAEDQT